MEFKDIMIAMAVLAIGIFAFLGLASELNTQWGTSIADDFSSDYEEIRIGLVGNVTSDSQAIGAAGTPEEGQSLGTGDDGLISRSLRILALIPNLVGMPLKMIGAAGASLGVPPFITLMAQSVLVFSFFLTLAYVFITGTRRIRGV